MVNKWRNQLVDALFPQLCLLCRLPSANPLPLCTECAAQLVENRCSCYRCALPLPEGGPALCAACLEQPPLLDGVLAPFIYEPHLGYLIGQWKFQGQRRLSGLLACLWLAAVDPPQDRDMLLPVPIHWRRLLGRGFNQASLLAGSLQQLAPELAGVTLQDRLLRRCRPTPAQSSLNAQQRARNLSDAFKLKGAVKGKRIAIIDDVMTTGATGEAIARALKAAGAEDVQLWCLARTPPPPT
jgi:ComF family protein